MIRHGAQYNALAARISATAICGRCRLMQAPATISEPCGPPAAERRSAHSSAVNRITMSAQWSQHAKIVLLRSFACRFSRVHFGSQPVRRQRQSLGLLCAGHSCVSYSCDRCRDVGRGAWAYSATSLQHRSAPGCAIACAVGFPRVVIRLQEERVTAAVSARMPVCVSSQLSRK